MFGEKAVDVRTRLAAIEALFVVKRWLGQKRVAEALDISPSVLSRYSNGRSLPSRQRAEAILAYVMEQVLPELIGSVVKRTGEGLYDLSVAMRDPNLLRLIALTACAAFRAHRPTKVLTVATDGIPYATAVASELGAELVVAKDWKDPVYDEFVEERVVRSPPVVEYLYIPRRALRRNDNVLIVDDVIRSGRTVAALHRMAVRSGANPIGVFALASIADSAQRLGSEHGVKCQVKVIVNLS
ncbi:MAG: phosphoribosyltransferase family protein [Thaumarchaeota archaeon]|nr:phosphoribosyltransferase family protein [Candidatus Calditenuaceae archaeon]MCX8202725.1 phosphoribosyltransferase family protein [Nitrososphaeria archaeon]MDW8043051.1 phosphoribosyltransferase family protein [Nitrososphaerota archaeon]